MSHIALNLDPYNRLEEFLGRTILAIDEYPIKTSDYDIKTWVATPPGT